MWHMVVYMWTLWVLVHATKDTSYLPEELATEVMWGYGLAVHWRANMLYFNYENITLYSFTSAILDLEKKTLRVIEELSGRCAFAIDQRRGDVYAGCESNTDDGGLYQRNSYSGKFMIIGAEGESVLFVHYADSELYYSSTSKYQVHTYANGKMRVVPELAKTIVWELAVDGKGNWIYRNANGLFRMTPRTGIVTEFVKGLGVRALDTSSNGEVYTCDYLRKGVYVVDANMTLRQVVPKVYCSGLTLNMQDDFIYADWVFNKIIHLIKS